MKHDAPGEADFVRWIGAIAQHRDRAAFSALFDYFAPRIKAYFHRSGFAGNLADDLAQETMLQVWRRAILFDPDRAAAAAWIFAIARNRRIDAVRRERGLPVADPSAEPDPVALPDASLSAFERERLVRSAMSGLPPEQAEVVELSFFDDRPHAEIARTLGLPLGTVKSRLRLAMIRLRNALGDLT